MNHLEAGTLQALLDGELAGADREAVDVHVATCGNCTSELQGLRAASTEFAAAMAVLDVPAPMLNARASLDDRHGRAIDEGRRRAVAAVAGAPAAFLKAAAVVLMLAGAASAAIPGSPVRRWASELFDRASRLFGGEAEPARATAPPALQPETVVAVEPTQEPASGIRIAPSAGRVRIALHSVAGGTRITIRHTDSALASLDFAASVGDPPQYRSSAGSIDAYGIDRTDVVIWLPRSLARATVEVDGRLFYTRRDGEERILGPGAESREDGVTFLMRS